MADLHKFRDDARTKEDRVKPIQARHLDENFTTVRLKLSSKLAAVFRIRESVGKNDELDLIAGIGSSRYVLGIENGALTLFEVEEC